MSQKNNNSRPLFVRIMAGVLAFLLIIGTVIMAIELIFDASAEEPGELETYAFSSDMSSEKFYVAVSLKYGTGMKHSYGFLSPFGFAVGEAYVTTKERSFTPLWLYDETNVIVASDVNLAVSSTFTCTEAADEASTDIGAYNVEVKIDPNYVDPLAADSSATPADIDIWDCVSDLSTAFGEMFRHVFPALTNGIKSVHVGAFATYAEASEAAGAVSATLEGFLVSVVSPTNDGVMVLNEDCSKVVFEYNNTEGKILAICARQFEGEDRSYICLDSSKLYDGAMCFRRTISGETQGLLLSNLVELKEYLEGVVPSEIYTSWPTETIKAFAIAANTFIVDSIGMRYKTDYTDVRASSNDQNYGGRTGVTDRIIEAVSEAKNWVIAYTDAAGKTSIITCFYASSNGGTTIDSKYAWSGSVGPYIASHLTMWEDYYNSAGAKGFWTREYTPTELCTKLKNGGVKLLGTKVTDVSYNTTGDSSYVYSITFTDDLGTVATVTKTQKVCAALGSGILSANFVIGQGTLDFYYDDVISNRIINLTGTYSGELSVQTATGKFNVATSLLNFFTSLGKADKDDSYSTYVQTAQGKAILVEETDVPVTSFPDENGMYNYVSDFGDFLIVSELKHVEVTSTAQAPENFIIAGKGYGHGVGMSQFGAMHLGKAGATAEQIIRAYFLDTHLEDFNEWRRTH